MNSPAEARHNSDGMLWATRAACARTPIVIDGAIREDVVSELRDEILRRRSRSPGSHPSLNVGGWRSGEELFSWPALAVRDLEAVIRSRIGGASYLVGWAVVNAGGSYHPRHRHAMGTVSGVCYIDPGNPAVPTIFESSSGLGEEIHVVPAIGRIVLFASDTWHRVPVYNGADPRITIAFDARR